MNKYFFRQLPLSCLLARTLRVNKIAMYSFCRSESALDTSFRATLLLAPLRQLVTPFDDRAFSIWSFQRKQGRPLRRLPQMPCRRSILLHSNDMTKPAQPMHVNTLHNVYVVEKFMQLADG